MEVWQYIVAMVEEKCVIWIDDINVEFDDLSFDVVFGKFSEGYDDHIWGELEIGSLVVV